MSKQIKSIIVSIVTAVVIAFLISTFLIQNIVVPTRSMEPFIQAEDRIFALRTSYMFNDPERGDVVVFNSNHEDKLLVKRIIGLPGETVEIKDGLIYINNEVIEDYTKLKTDGNFPIVTVPKGEYFMLGDYRNKSNDSRYWDDQFIEKDEITGKVWFKYYPRRKFL